MDENTAFRLGRDWLTRLAIDNRLALLADQALWIVTITAAEDDVTTVEIERVELGAERVRVALTETHGDDFDTPVVHNWRADFEFERKPLEFRAEGRWARGEVRVGDRDKDALAFGQQLAEATGWPKPS